MWKEGLGGSPDPVSRSTQALRRSEGQPGLALCCCLQRGYLCVPSNSYPAIVDPALFPFSLPSSPLLHWALREVSLSSRRDQCKWHHLCAGF